MKKLLLFVLVITCLEDCTIGNSKRDNVQKDSDKSLTAEEIYKQSIDKVALVISYVNGIPLSQGSGFFVDKNTFVTNYHCVAGSSAIELKTTNDESLYKGAKIIKASEKFDLAIIQTKKDFPFLEINNSGNETVGSKIYTIGNPRGLEGTISDGIISGKRTSEGIDYLQITAPTSPGNSGGPVLNDKGEVIGVSTFTYRNSQNLNFAMPIKYLDKCEDYDYSRGSERKTFVSQDSAISIAVYRKPIFDSEEYSIRNNSSDYITNIEAILIYKNQAGEVLNFRKLRTIRDVLPPGMAKLYKGSFRNDNWIYYNGDWHPSGVVVVGQIMYDVELRVLSYEIAE